MASVKETVKTKTVEQLLYYVEVFTGKHNPKLINPKERLTALDEIDLFNLQDGWTAKEAGLVIDELRDRTEKEIKRGPLTARERKLLAELDKCEKERRKKMTRFANNALRWSDEDCIEFLKYYMSEADMTVYGLMHLDIQNNPENALRILLDVYDMITDEYARIVINTLMARAHMKIAELNANKDADNKDDDNDDLDDFTRAVYELSRNMRASAG